VAGRNAAHLGDRGGERIQATRTLRVGLSFASLALATGLAAYPPLAASGLERLIAVGGVFGVLALAVGLLGAPSALPWALAAIGGEYAAFFALRGGSVDTRAPVYAAGLLVVAELAYWAGDRRSPARPDRELEVRRLVGILIAAVGSIALGALVLGISSASVGSGVALEALGVACAVALLVIVAVVVRADRDPRPEV
jgi:hypothetical protein